MTQESLLEFPCDYPLKVMGQSGSALEQLVLDIVNRHAGPLPEGCLRLRPSRTGKYLAITLTFRASSQAQLDAIYRELSGHPLVAMAL